MFAGRAAEHGIAFGFALVRVIGPVAVVALAGAALAPEGDGSALHPLGKEFGEGLYFGHRYAFPAFLHPAFLPFCPGFFHIVPVFPVLVVTVYLV